MILRQFVSIFTLSDTEFGREQHHLKRSKFVFRRASGSLQFFHHTVSVLGLESLSFNAGGEPYWGKPEVRFDEGVLRTTKW